MPKFHLITEKLSKNIRLKILSTNTAAFSTCISKLSRENNVKRCTLSRFFAFLINAAVLYLRFLSTLWPILQLIAHHIQDKLAVSFDSSSIGLISYKCFLTIDAKYSSVKAYNEENSFFREKNTFSEYSKSIICMYVLTLSPLLIYEGRSKICKFIFISHQVLKP